MTRLLKLLKGNRYDFVSIGLPAPVVHGRLLGEPHNLGSGWVGFNFAEAFQRPVRILNDAAMQALGSYEGGRMLFLAWAPGSARPWWLTVMSSRWNWRTCRIATTTTSTTSAKRSARKIPSSGSAT